MTDSLVLELYDGDMNFLKQTAFSHGVVAGSTSAFTIVLQDAPEKIGLVNVRRMILMVEVPAIC